jgi:hypothetical protein
VRRKNRVKVNPDPPAADQPKEIDPKLLPSIESITEEVGILSSIVVYINEPCDEEWRAKYPSNWMYWANYAIEQADNKLYEWFGIDYRSKAQVVWYSSSTTAEGLVDEAKREVGLGGADLMIAFTGQDTGVGGIVWRIGYPYALVCWQGSAYDWIVARHESGHCYGLEHCSSTCIMNPATAYTAPNSICSTHKNQCYNARYKY